MTPMNFMMYTDILQNGDVKMSNLFYKKDINFPFFIFFKFQKELFSSKVESADTGRDRKMSSSSTGSMKSKWMKAFKSLKTPPTNGTAAKESEK